MMTVAEFMDILREAPPTEEMPLSETLAIVDWSLRWRKLPGVPEGVTFGQLIEYLEHLNLDPETDLMDCGGEGPWEMSAELEEIFAAERAYIQTNVEPPPLPADASDAERAIRDLAKDLKPDRKHTIDGYLRKSVRGARKKPRETDK